MESSQFGNCLTSWSFHLGDLWTPPTIFLSLHFFHFFLGFFTNLNENLRCYMNPVWDTHAALLFCVVVLLFLLTFFLVMTRTSVLADALNAINNAEKTGKRQVLIRPSSKVIIKFLQVMQKHGMFFWKKIKITKIFSNSKWALLAIFHPTFVSYLRTFHQAPTHIYTISKNPEMITGWNDRCSVPFCLLIFREIEEGTLLTRF